ncbi:MAG: type VI secretion system protein TssA [Acidobacteria bacterium]|nr:MAG: type VI secretion system protein TssA [Acidobacteriota bacterium]
MPFPDDLLNPIEGANPSGANLRYDPVYDKIKEARREETQPPPGMTEQDRKVSDNPQVIKLTTDLLTNKTKDLQLAAWLTEAWLKQRGFGGLKDGLALCCGLVDKFWDTLYPEIDEGDAESRGAPLGFLGVKLDIPIKLVPVVEKAKYGLLDHKQSRDVGYEDQVKGDEAKKKRAQLVKEGKLTPELFDKAFEETPKKFYAQAEKDLDACLENLTRLKKSCDEKFGNEGPAFGPLQSALDASRHLIHGFLQKKREKEPDPVEEVPAAEAALGAEGAGGPAVAGPVRTGVLISVDGSSEPPDRIDAIKKIAEAAAFLRRREPQSPASYLMLRGLRWGELRAAIELADPTKLEAPPTDLRRHLKKLLLDKKYEELLEAAESAMALPCSRAWLDMQRFVVEACEALGSGYEAIARAIRSELKALVTDIPQLLDATLMDETPAANAETRAWLVSLSQAPASAPPADGTAHAASSNGLGSRWPGQPTDAYVSALQALRDGHERKAFEILQQDIARKRSGRERFRRRMQLVEICATTNKPNVAQPILDDVAAAIENHKLDEWEDPGLVASALATLMKMSVKIQADKAAQQKIFERICRLDPAQPLGDAK